MKFTGIVRRIDDLGRVVIPRDIRHTLGIKIDTPVEFYIEDNKIILIPYKPFKMASELLNEAIAKLECDKKYSQLINKIEEIIKALDNFNEDR